MSGIKDSFHNTKNKITKNVEKVDELLQLKTKLRENESEINSIYKKMGEQYFNQHFDNPLPELRDLVNEIVVNKSEEKKLIEQKNILSGLKICEFCGFANDKNAKYCANCGNPLQDIRRMCESCGEKVEENMLFCPKCGKKISGMSNGTYPGV